jgi:hypothetical protein
MESNIANQQSWSADLGLSQPHFDEQATLLSAQPVVPISRLSGRSGFSRKWLFGFALVGMLFIGIAASSLYYSRFITSESQPTPERDTTSSGIQGFASGLVAADETAKESSPVARPGSPSADSNRATIAKTEPRSVASTTLSRKPSKTVSKKKRRSVVNSRPDFEEETMPDFEGPARYERRASRREAWEERRPRRYNKRSDRRDRIRDILEGPPRP